MKKSIIILISLLFLSCNQSNLDNDKDMSNACECSNSPVEMAAWDYPVKPGMEEWKQFHSNEEMASACQIPQKVLSSLSTEDLTKICIEYPLLSDVFAFNFLSDGADKLYNDFNGIRELFKRENVSKELMKHYNCLMQEFEFDSKSVIPVWSMEFLLGFYTQKSDVLTKEDCKKMLQSLICGYEKEVVHADPAFSYPFPINYYARAHVIIKMSPQSIDKIRGGKFNSVFNSDRFDKETMDIIDKLSYELIK